MYILSQQQWSRNKELNFQALVASKPSQIASNFFKFLTIDIITLTNLTLWPQSIFWSRKVIISAPLFSPYDDIWKISHLNFGGLKIQLCWKPVVSQNKQSFCLLKSWSSWIAVLFWKFTRKSFPPLLREFFSSCDASQEDLICLQDEFTALTLNKLYTLNLVFKNTNSLSLCRCVILILDTNDFSLWHVKVKVKY